MKYFEENDNDIYLLIKHPILLYFAKLILQDTSLMIPAEANLTVDSYGSFEGQNAQFHAAVRKFSHIVVLIMYY